MNAEVVAAAHMAVPCKTQVETRPCVLAFRARGGKRERPGQSQSKSGHRVGGEAGRGENAFVPHRASPNPARVDAVDERLGGERV
jgi:hypothetical protein